MLFVFDTNVIVSALLIQDSNPSRALCHAENTGTLLYSTPVIEEIAQVLSRPKLNKYIDSKDIDGFLARIHRSWKNVEIMHAIQECRDPKDDKFLELAVNGQADMIVTGDQDLLSLNSFRDIMILTPSEFLEYK